MVATAANATVTTTEFAYQGAAIVEESVNGTVVRQFVTDESGSIAKMIIPSGANAGTYLVTWNGHGDALNLLRVDPGDGTTELANSFSYSTWDTPTVDGSHDNSANSNADYGDLGFRFLYVGQFDVQWDNQFGLGLLYMHARHHAPALGRFLQPDPAGLELNQHQYAANAPISSIDPAGTAPWRNGGVKFGIQAWPISGLWGVSVAGGFRFNGATVEKLWVNCQTWGFGYDVDVKWCGVWNSRLVLGGKHMDFGADIKVSAVARGFPVQVSHWVRLSADRNGRVFNLRKA